MRLVATSSKLLCSTSARARPASTCPSSRKSTGRANLATHARMGRRVAVSGHQLLDVRQVDAEGVPQLREQFLRGRPVPLEPCDPGRRPAGVLLAGQPGQFPGRQTARPPHRPEVVRQVARHGVPRVPATASTPAASLFGCRACCRRAVSLHYPPLVTGLRPRRKVRSAASRGSGGRYPVLFDAVDQHPADPRPIDSARVPQQG
jgi:hypothetical protein